MGRPDVENLIRRAEAARAVRHRTPLADQEEAARSALQELTRQRDLQVEDARRRALQEWWKTGPEEPRMWWFGRQRRQTAWRRAMWEFVAAAENAAVDRYNATYLQTHGEDFDELVRAAQEEHRRLQDERREEHWAADREIEAVIKALYRECRWSADKIAERLWLKQSEVRSVLNLPRPASRSRASGGGGGGDLAGFGCGSGCGGGGGGGGGGGE